MTSWRAWSVGGRASERINLQTGNRLSGLDAIATAVVLEFAEDHIDHRTADGQPDRGRRGLRLAVGGCVGATKPVGAEWVDCSSLGVRRSRRGHLAPGAAEAIGKFDGANCRLIVCVGTIAMTVGVLDFRCSGRPGAVPPLFTNLGAICPVFGAPAIARSWWRWLSGCASS